MKGWIFERLSLYWEKLVKRFQGVGGMFLNEFVWREQ